MSHPKDRQHLNETAQSDPESKSRTGATAEDSAELEEAGLRQDADRIGRLEADLEDFRQTLVRRQADFDNYRKRMERERRETQERVLAHLAESLLPVLDNFERALAAHQDPAYENYRLGFAMIHRQLADLLAQNGIVRMPDQTGQPFDPRLHHALDRVETDDYPEGTVVGELQAGYQFRDRILRPAQVRVSAGGSSEATTPTEVN